MHWHWFSWPGTEAARQLLDHTLCLASCQPQASRFLWIPLTSVTPIILLQASSGDFPGSWNQNFPGPDYSGKLPSTRDSSRCLAWILACGTPGWWAPKDASRWCFHTVTALQRPLGSSEASSCIHTKADKLSQTPYGRHALMKASIYHIALFFCREKSGIFFPLLLHWCKM